MAPLASARATEELCQSSAGLVPSIFWKSLWDQSPQGIVRTKVISLIDSSGPAQTSQVILNDEDPCLYMALYILYTLTPSSSPPPHPNPCLPELTVHFQLIPISSATVEHPQYLCAPVKLDLTRSQLPWRLPKWQLFSLKHLMSCWALLFTADSYVFPDRKHAYSWAHICTCIHTHSENPSFQFIPQANKHLDMITLCQALTWFNLRSAMSYVCFYPQFTECT